MTSSTVSSCRIPSKLTLLLFLCSNRLNFCALLFLHCPTSGGVNYKMSKCPYASKADVPSPPPNHPTIDEVKEGEPMCPYARKALEAKKKEEAAKSKDSDQKDWSQATPDEFKKHFTEAYDEMSQHPKAKKDKAHIAAILMGQLGYTDDELAVIGDDVQLMQGTGNPHALARIAEGEFVVDLGSGFGIDAIVAAAKVGTTGRVVGIDLAINEVAAAIKRVQTRGLRNVDFRLGDIESPPFADSSVDCVISNGGFCLVPRKDVAFQQIFRILKPGGRFSVSCTVRKKDLDASKDWPSCMLVFMPLATVHSVLSSIGFHDIVVDDSNSSMTVWDEAKAKAEAPIDDEGAKITIHKGESRYDFLKNLDMNEFFARVNIFASKPSA